MSKDNTTEGQQQVQAVSVSPAAGEALRRLARQHGVVTAFFPVSARPNTCCRFRLCLHTVKQHSKSLITTDI